MHTYWGSGGKLRSITYGTRLRFLNLVDGASAGEKRGSATVTNYYSHHLRIHSQLLTHERGLSFLLARQLIIAARVPLRAKHEWFYGGGYSYSKQR